MKALRIALSVTALFISGLTVSFGQTCITPSDLAANSVTAERATAIWESEPGAVAYYIEIREAGSTWISNQAISDTSHTFSDLTGCTGYELRVRSICQSGPTSLSYSAWHSPVAFKTACSILPDEIKIAAKTASVNGDIVVRWAPMNFGTWEWGNQNGWSVKRITLNANGVPLSADDRFNSEVVLDSTLMPIPEWEWKPMSDTSDFAGVAAGSLYGDSLEVSSFDSIDIIDAFNYYQQDENRFAMSLFAADQEYAVAKAMGLVYKDITAAPGEEYLYTVEPNNLPSDAVYEPGVALQKTNDALVLPKPPTVKPMPGDSSVTLAWDKSDINSYYSAYSVEKSIDGGTSFQAVNSMPLVGTDANPNLALFTDTLDNNTTVYKYRIRGISPFGLIGPYSDIVDVQGIPSRTPANPSIIKVTETASGAMDVTWNFPAEYISKVQGFEIYRSKELKKGFQKITTTLLPAATTLYTDAAPLSTGYYIVKAIDVNNYELQSNPQLAQINDTTPPAAPSALQCPCDASGKVSLSWARGSEEDLWGYRVFTSTVEAGDYVVITPQIIKDSFYVHQLNLNTLSEEAYFKILAFDNRENRSGFSAVCTASRPDIIPPSPPNITLIQPSEEDIYFEWINSSSDDVTEHKFQRKITGTNDWETLYQYPQVSRSNFTDTTASNRKTYKYRLLAYDEAGNFSSSIIVEGKSIDTGVRDSIKNFTAALSTTTVDNSTISYVQLSWDYSFYEDLAGFQIYRAVNLDPMVPYEYITADDAADQAFGSGNFGFIDKNIKNLRGSRNTPFNLHNLPPNIPSSGITVSVANPPNPSNPLTIPARSNVIQYQIVAEYTDGGYSPVTNIVAVIVPN